jgi:hyperosmotically inducible periplasmic protein
MNAGRLLVLCVSSSLLNGFLLSGCAAFGKCSTDSCAADAAITANVTARLAHYPALGANSVRIQTLNQVVYLTGVVDTDVERFLAVSVADEVDGVKRVVDSISVDNVPR